MRTAPSSLEGRLDALHRRVRANAAWQRLAVLSRLLLALAFIPTGAVKALGRPFTVMGTDTLIGQFFDVMWRTGPYWRFIGISQIVAGLLLLTPRTTALGALLFLPIVGNIFVITIALQFTGTPFVTGPMLVACVFLLCWDYPRWKELVFVPTGDPWWPTRSTRLERWGFLSGGGAALFILLTTRGLASPAVLVAAFAALGASAVVVLASWTYQWRAARRPRNPS